MSTIQSGLVYQLPKEENNTLYFGFDPIVIRRVVKLDKFDFYVALNFLGSNMGLLPGLGIFQICQSAVATMVGFKVINKIFNLRRK